MTYKRTVASLLAALLTSVHCQPLATLLSGSGANIEDQLSIEDHGEFSPNLNEVDGSSEELQITADTTEEYADETGELSNIDDTLDTIDAPETSEDTDDVRSPLQDALDDPARMKILRENPEGRTHAVGIFLRQLLPLIASAFFSSVTTVIFNWFYPFKVVPPPPGLVGVSQLWGGLPHPKHWHHHWGHLHQGPGKWGDGNWGHAYWGPAYSGHTPPAPPARPWEPHPHAHL